MTSALIPSLSKLVLVFTLFFCISLADVTPSTSPLTPDEVCRLTRYPDYCISTLPQKGSYNIYDYSRYTSSESLWSAKNLSGLIDSYLKDRSTLSKSAIGALEDCRVLTELSIDFLQSSSGIINKTQSLSTVQVEDLQTMFSAAMTNLDTCSVGLQETNAAVDEGLSSMISNGSKLYSVSLALFSLGWVNQKSVGNPRSGRKLLFSDMEPARHGGLPLAMQKQHRKVYESVSGRKLLQAPTTVLVRAFVVVNPDGSGNFTTINSAIDSAPNNTLVSGGYFVIHVVAGLYNEYIAIPKYKRWLMIIGDGIDQTVITGNRSVADGFTTFNSATFAVLAPGFVAINVTFRNTAGAIKHQAVAFRNGADLSAIYSCSFEGYQDTLYTHSNRQFYRDCDIYGTVDFIFGNAATVIQNCNIVPLLPMSGQFNALTAQNRDDPNQNTGISIHNCVITAHPDLAATNGTTQTFLGRPWKQYSRVVYMQSFMDSSIHPFGWHEWSGTFGLSTLYYAEYNNTGPGSDTSGRVTWLGYHVINSTEATSFTVSNFILGNNWLPASGVPYDGDLL